MLKRILVFVSAFCLSLALMQLLKPKSQSNMVETVSDPAVQNSPLPVQTNKQTSFNIVSASKNLFLNFQDAVAKNDRKAVISLIKFPVYVNKPYFRKIKSEKEFLSNYDKILDNSFKNFISKITTDQFVYSTSLREAFAPGIGMVLVDKNSGADFDIKIEKFYNR